jgi:hypothetical protein
MSKSAERRQVIINICRQNGTVTKKEIVDIAQKGCWYYCNASKYVGEILSTLVKQGHLVRLKAGTFKLGSGARITSQVEDPKQISLF